jgi:hypothetical protein
MNILLRLKHWQLFIVFILSLTLRNFGPIYSIVFLFWLVAINANCIKKLKGRLKTLCTVLLCILSVAIVFLILFTAATMYQLNSFVTDTPVEKDSAILNFFSALMSYDFIISVYVLPALVILGSALTSKLFKSVMINSNAGFSSYAAEFVYMLFSPGGVWIIQPQLNEMVKGNLVSSIDFT